MKRWLAVAVCIGSAGMLAACDLGLEDPWLSGQAVQQHAQEWVLESAGPAKAAPPAATAAGAASMLGYEKPLPPDPQLPSGPGALAPGMDCAQLESVVKARVIQAMDAAVDYAKENAAWEYCSWYYWDVDCDDDGIGNGGDPQPTASGESASEYSQTNTQVAGVDEADFIKNDGAYIYLVANGAFRIVDAWPPETAATVAEVPIEGEPRKLYVTNDRALVYVSGGPVDPLPDLWNSLGSGPYGYYSYGNGQECTYGYDCDFSGDGRKMTLLTFDISDRSNPLLLRRTEVSGSYLNSRRIGNTVYTVAAFPPNAVPGLSVIPPELFSGSMWQMCGEGTVPDDLAAAFDALKASNKAAIEAAALEDLLPGMTDTVYLGDVAVDVPLDLGDCQSFLVSPVESQPGYLGMLAVDMVDDSQVQATVIVGKPGAVYASAESLYVAVRQYKALAAQWPFAQDGPSEVTVLHKFGLDPANVTAWYEASGTAKGRILNQFSMDEHEGFLRIATTTGHLPSPDVHSTVSVLEQQGSALVPAGIIDPIAPTEDIRSARFNGKVGFIVTFKKTDPLFVLDLADPHAPTIKGELKIPGFSTYMHLLDDNHILSIGYDADDQGSFAWFQGIMLQLFDVSDMANPQLLHKEVIGTRGSTSDAATNHLAFNFFKPKSWLGLPMVVCEQGGGGTYGDEMTFNGLMIYKVTTDSGFEYLGGIPHPATGGTVSCGNWWTNSNSPVKRSVFMDDYVYSVAMDEIRVAAVANPAQLLAAVPLL